MDTAVDPQGGLLISDDQSGTIYRLSGPATPLATSPAKAAAGAQLYPNPSGGPATLDLTALPPVPTPSRCSTCWGAWCTPASRPAAPAPN
ncbi:MAG: hypothetical protein WKG07_28235 [Hymenobacter sp.]